MNSFQALLNPVTLSWLTMQPLIVQVLKAQSWLPFINSKTAGPASLLGVVMAMLLPQWGALQGFSGRQWFLTAGEVIVGWLYCEVIYSKIVAPMAASNNPLVPKNPGPVVVLLACLLLGLAPRAQAADAIDGPRVFGAALVVNGLWYDAQDPIKSDIEGGLALKASLSPHISLVGSSSYGAIHRYWRYAGGVRITATDVENRNFSVGFGFQFRGNYDDVLKPDEWAPDATVGWRPWPSLMPDVVLLAQGWYGIDTNRAGALAGARYVLPF